MRYFIKTCNKTCNKTGNKTGNKTAHEQQQQWVANPRCISRAIAITVIMMISCLSILHSGSMILNNYSGSTSSQLIYPYSLARAQQQQQRDSVAICAIQKGAQLYLEEWIDYNHILGFDKIYLYDNSDDHELKNWTYSPSDILDIHHFPGEMKQFLAYEHCAARVQQEQVHTWVAFFDLDEFLVLKRHQHVIDLIDDIVQQSNNQRDSNNSFIIGGIAINWYVFDYNNHTKYEPLPSTYRFQRQQNHVNHHVKTIVNISQFKEPNGNPHCFLYHDANAIALDPNGHILPHPQGPFHADGPTDVAVIHHIHTKSVEEYQKRCARGRADATMEYMLNESPLFCRSEAEILDNFQMSDNNLVMDSAAWDVLVQGMPQKYGKLA